MVPTEIERVAATAVEGIDGCLGPGMSRRGGVDGKEKKKEKKGKRRAPIEFCLAIYLSTY